MKLLTIGALAEQTGVSADTLRYYGKMRLIAAAGRSEGGYRLYAPDTVGHVRFIRGAKALGFTLEEIRRLLELKASDTATCSEILQHAREKLVEAERRIRELREMKKVLQDLVARCPADDSPAECCPILDHISKKGKALVAAFFCAVALLVSPRAAEAKPIPFAGGWMVMQENSQSENLLHIVYSPVKDVAVGYSGQWMREDEYWLHSAQFNYLAKRWNMPEAQGNIFLLSGLGVAGKDGETEPAAWAGLLADYETRRIFVSYENHVTEAGDIDRSFWQKGRVGVAPYIGGYKDLNTWLMMQVDHQPGMDETFVVTPLVRFYKGTTLAEFGYSSNDRLLFNWNITF
jgi:DNA-binding transcriptional MerR regulator